MRAVALLALAAALGQSPTPADTPKPQASPPVFATGVELVALDVTVVDAQGRPLRDLNAADFEVRVGGRPRRVVTAEFVEQTGEAPEAPPAPAPAYYSTNEGLAQGRLVLFAVDENNIRFGRGRDVVRAAEKLLDRLGPADRVGLLTVPGPYPREEFTTDHEKIREALKKTVGRGRFQGRRLTLTEALSYARREDTFYWDEALRRECSGDMLCERELESEAFEVASNFDEQSSRSIQTLRAALEALKGVQGQKVLVLVSQGMGIPNTGPRLTLPTELRDLGAAARAARVSLYAVQVAQDIFPEFNSRLQASQMTDDQMFLEQGLSTFADFAGGEVLRGNPEQAYERIAREIAGYYLVGFEPQPADRDGKEHDVKVKVARSGVDVRLRPRVTIPEAGKAPDDKTLVRTALSAPVIEAGLPVRAGTWALRDVDAGKIRLLIRAEVGQDAAPAGLTLGFAVFDAKGKSVAGAVQTEAPSGEAAAEPFHYETAVTVAPGNYTVRVAARDARGRQGSVDHKASAALTAAGDFEMSDLLLGSAPTPGQSYRPELEPIAGERPLAAYLDVYHASPAPPGDVGVWLDVIQPSTATTLRTLRAQLHATRQPGRFVAQALVPSNGLTAGDYIVRASVMRDGKPLGSVARPFRIVSP